MLGGSQFLPNSLIDSLTFDPEDCDAKHLHKSLQKVMKPSKDDRTEKYYEQIIS